MKDLKVVLDKIAPAQCSHCHTSGALRLRGEHEDLWCGYCGTSTPIAGIPVWTMEPVWVTSDRHLTRDDYPT